MRLEPPNLPGWEDPDDANFLRSVVLLAGAFLALDAKDEALAALHEAFDRVATEREQQRR